MAYTFNDEDGKWEAVERKSKLKQLNKLGLIEFPAKYGGGLQVRGAEGKSSRFERFEPVFNMVIKYQVKYVDGSIYPFLFMLVPKFGSVSSYQHYY